MVDVILDSAGQKGTGKWTSQSSLDLGVPLSIITESVFSRFISVMKEERVAASKKLNGPATAAFDGDAKELTNFKLYQICLWRSAIGIFDYRT
jgi:6-phosphogluconate dehydrogenase